mmetsp:Transcript_25363/g.80258  ORF Transcript_25363/g.80258 Transcript_25363/m.80258 type:complete len:347 (+) Transcript_25363:12158-13198(+)
MRSLNEDLFIALLVDQFHLVVPHDRQHRRLPDVTAINGRVVRVGRDYAEDRGADGGVAGVAGHTNEGDSEERGVQLSDVAEPIHILDKEGQFVARNVVHRSCGHIKERRGRVGIGRAHGEGERRLTHMHVIKGDCEVVFPRLLDIKLHVAQGRDTVLAGQVDLFAILVRRHDHEGRLFHGQLGGVDVADDGDNTDLHCFASRRRRRIFPEDRRAFKIRRDLEEVGIRHARTCDERRRGINNVIRVVELCADLVNTEVRPRHVESHLVQARGGRIRHGSRRQLRSHLRIAVGVAAIAAGARLHKDSEVLGVARFTKSVAEVVLGDNGKDSTLAGNVLVVDSKLRLNP